MDKIEPVVRIMSEPKDDLVERLRERAEYTNCYGNPTRDGKTMIEAADHIEAQAKLIEALQKHVYHHSSCPAMMLQSHLCTCGLTTLLASIKEPT